MLKNSRKNTNYFENCTKIFSINQIVSIQIKDSEVLKEIEYSYNRNTFYINRKDYTKEQLLKKFNNKIYFFAYNAYSKPCVKIILSNDTIFKYFDDKKKCIEYINSLNINYTDFIC